MDRNTQDAIEALERGQRWQRRLWLASVVVVVVTWATQSNASHIASGDLVTFTANTPARASEVNHNFSVLAAAINDNDARVSALETRNDHVPRGTIAFFAGACPTGWGPYTAANGRYVVASGGTVGGTAAQVGDAMGNLADDTHTHSIAPHSHAWATWVDGEDRWKTWNSGGGLVNVRANHRDFDNGDSRHFAILHHRDEPDVTHYTTRTATQTTNAITRSEIAPYIQLRACIKS